MKLSEILKPDNEGLSVRHRSWTKDYYVILKNIQFPKFDLEDSFGCYTYTINDDNDSDGWSYNNSQKIKNRLGVK